MSKMENSTQKWWICKSCNCSVSICLLSAGKRCRSLVLNRPNPSWVSGEIYVCVEMMMKVGSSGITWLHVEEQLFHTCFLVHQMSPWLYTSPVPQDCLLQLLLTNPDLSIILIHERWKYSCTPSTFCPLIITFFPAATFFAIIVTTVISKYL